MFLEVSAKTAHNVEEAFTLSAKKILENIDNNKSEVQSQGFKLEKDKPNKNRQDGCQC